MNKQRRQELLDVIDPLEDAILKLEEIRDEEQDVFDNLPEGLQCGVRGDSMQEAIDTMEGWINDIVELIQKIDKYAKRK